jgi:CheY-like chemotaxis protein
MLSSALRAYEARHLHLAEELGRRCALFIENARLHQAERRATQARDEVLGIVAHDLRNPLANILLHTALLRGPDERPDPRSRKPADSIERAAKRVSRIIDELLDVTRLESGRLAIERARISAAELMAEVAESHGSFASSTIELRCDVPQDLPDVRAERSRVLRVFENLMSNALKCTAQGSISIGAKQLADEVVFWVADTGVGIAEQDLPRVFDRFWQGRKAERGSAGLGLAIVKGIVEAHGGRAWVESQLGVGTTFYFTLLIAREVEPAAVATEAIAMRSNVLVAEDDSDAREMLVALLRHHGYDATSVANGREALDEIHRPSPPRLVLLDLSMPIMDGWAFLGERERDPALRSIPVIVISGEREPAERVTAVGAKFLRKPIVPDQLLKLIEETELQLAAAS